MCEAQCVLCFQENNMIVYVEKKVLEDPAIASDENFGPVKKKFCTFREGVCLSFASWFALALGAHVLEC